MIVMSALKDLTGKKIGRLTVIKKVGKRGKHVLWLCRCDCGNETVVYSTNLLREHTISCGCFQRERVAAVNSIRMRTHGMSKTRLHKIWSGMIERCYLKSTGSYLNYGGRGITVCKEWGEFLPFYVWSMANGYSDNLTLDRIDVNGNYEPDNCRWATSKQQGNNRRNNIRITCDGITHTESEWCEVIGTKHSGVVKRRIDSGWSVKDAVSIPVGTINNYQYAKRKGEISYGRKENTDSDNE